MKRILRNLKRILQKKIVLSLFLTVLLTVLLTNSCVDSNDYSAPIVNCEAPVLQVTNTIGQIKEMAGFGIVEFTEDIIIEGYVVSSDESGNIYKSIFIQDLPENPTAAICIVLDQTNFDNPSHLK